MGLGWLRSWFDRSSARQRGSSWRVSVTPTGFTSQHSFPGSAPSQRSFAWEAIVGAHEERAAPGLQILLAIAPYVEFVPRDAEGFGELAAELGRRRLIGPDEKVEALWTERLSEILNETIERLFGPDRSPEARAILAAEASGLHPRIALAVLAVGGEDPEKLSSYAEQARDDARDVLHAAWS